MATAVDIAGTGFTVLDRLYVGRSSTQSLGGSCGNILLSLAMLEHTVAPVLSLGCDDVGDFLIRVFEEAGADVRFIARHSHISSPVLAQLLNLETGQHVFSFYCPETKQELPRYSGIRDDDLQRAREVIYGCSLFYTDRLSLTIIEAMEAAATTGSTVYFEPSCIDDDELFRRALRVTDILKFSADRLPECDLCDLPATAIAIVTYGSSGLSVRGASREVWCEAIPAPVVRDTCGSGDMVSVGLIDRLLSDKTRQAANCNFDRIMDGVVAGQRLAAANCAFPGARGLFERYGAMVARRILTGHGFAPLHQLDLFD